MDYGIVLDDNGSESILDLKMKQPMAADLNYKVSIFCTKYEMINNFNILVNHLFTSRQCYIWPNEHPMPMTLESISDESSYQIDDRQFYAQTYNIKVMGYVITENDYKVEEIPLKRKVEMPTDLETPNRKKADVEIDEEETEILITFPVGCKRAKFTIDTDFDVKNMETTNNRSMKIMVNEVEIVGKTFSLSDGDEIEVEFVKIHKDKEATLQFLK